MQESRRWFNDTVAIDGHEAALAVWVNGRSKHPDVVNWCWFLPYRQAMVVAMWQVSREMTGGQWSVQFNMQRGTKHVGVWSRVRYSPRVQGVVNWCSVMVMSVVVMCLVICVAIWSLG